MIFQVPEAKFGPEEARDLSPAHAPDGRCPGKGREGSGLRALGLGFMV